MIEFHRIAAADPNMPLDFQGGLTAFDRAAAQARERYETLLKKYALSLVQPLPPLEEWSEEQLEKGRWYMDRIRQLAELYAARAEPGASTSAAARS